MSHEIAINRIALARFAQEEIKLGREDAKQSEVKELVAVSFAALFVSITMVAIGYFTLQLAANLGMAALMSQEQLVILSIVVFGLYSIPVINATLKNQIRQMFYSAAPMFFVVGGIMFNFVHTFGH